MQLGIQQHDGEGADGVQDEVLFPTQDIRQVRADDVTNVGTDDHHRQVATGAQHAQATLILEERWQPGGDGVVTAQGTGGQQRGTKGGEEYAGAKIS